MDFKSILFLVAVLVTWPAFAQESLISEDAALKKFEEAAKIYRKEIPVVDKSKDKVMVEPSKKVGADTKNNLKEETVKRSGIDYQPIEDIRVSVDMENKTIEQIVDHIIKQARKQAGEWKVKWRISPERNYIMSERVNLTAETDLSNFMSYLVDRVNNMTGIQLFVTVFDDAHIIVISDTYY